MNITIGQYIPGNSWLHRLDPRFKVLSLIVLMVATFIIPISSEITPLIMMGALIIGSIVLTMSARIPIGKVSKGLRGIVFLLTFTFILQLFYIQEGPLLTKEPITMYVSLSSVAAIILFLVFYNWSKRFIKFRTIYFFIAVFIFFLLQALLPYINITSYELSITEGGLLRAGFIFVRLTTVIFITSLLTFTTMTTDLNFAIESLLKPLKVVKFPVDMIAMLLSLTLRYIPTLLSETEKIMKAQASRGVEFKESKLREKIIQVISLLLPVFVISFNRAEDLANAMDVRGYVIGAPRTKIDQYHIGFNDIFTLIMSVVILLGIITLRLI